MSKTTEEASRGLDIIKEVYFIKKPDGTKKEWKIKTTHDSPESIDKAIKVVDEFKIQMDALYSEPEKFTERQKKDIELKATIALLDICFENFDLKETLSEGINYKKLSNTALDLKSFLVDGGGLDEMKLLVQRSGANLSILNSSRT